MIALVHAAFAVCAAVGILPPATPGRSDPRGILSIADSVSLRLNLPAYRLDVHTGESLTSYRVAIGSRRYPTPTGSFALLSIELNPGWIPPASDWARDREPMPPGPRNPMGRVKIEFRPTYYLHGTPEPESVGASVSHGCVRLRNEDALELGRRLLAWGRPDLDESTVSRWIADAAAGRRIPLERPAVLEIRYDLIEVNAGRVHIHSDPYRLRSDSTDALAQALLVESLAPAPVPAGMAARLLHLAGSGGFTISTDSVSAGRLPPPAGPPAD
jgi:murein L,D-transpeptidase YcbB/YkuD